MQRVIDYIAKTRGPSDWTVDGAVIQAYNVPVMAILTMGESWQGNHHAFLSRRGTASIHVRSTSDIASSSALRARWVSHGM